MSGTGSATAARPTRGVAARGAAGAGRRGRDRARARGWGGSRQDGSRDATALKTRRGRGRNEAGGKQQKEHQPPGPGFGIAHPSVNTPLTTAPAPPGRAPVLSARGSLPPPSPLAPARRPSGLVRRPGARRAKLRALRASGDFDAYWDFHEAREYERNHAQRYAARTAPPVSEPPPPPSPPRLRRVK